MITSIESGHFDCSAVSGTGIRIVNSGKLLRYTGKLPVFYLRPSDEGIAPRLSDAYLVVAHVPGSVDGYEGWVMNSIDSQEHHHIYVKGDIYQIMSNFCEVES